MKKFLGSLKFKIILVLASLMVGFMLYASTTEGFQLLPGRVISFIVTPIQDLSAQLSSSVGGFFSMLFNAQSISEENEQLRQENQQLRDSLIELEEAKRENEQLKGFLGIKESNPDIEFTPAFVIGRDPADEFYAFTIDVGAQAGVSVGDPVITDNGVVGIVSRVDDHTAKVMTLLDPSFNLGALDMQSRDPGSVIGEASLALHGYCKMTYLPLTSQAKQGDLVITSGIGGVFPENLVVGTVREVRTETSSVSLYAVVEPAVNVADVKDVYVITNFENQGSYVTGNEEQ